jgi:hypothetical protein
LCVTIDILANKIEKKRPLLFQSNTSAGVNIQKPIQLEEKTCPPKILF